MITRLARNAPRAVRYAPKLAECRCRCRCQGLRRNSTFGGQNDLEKEEPVDWSFLAGPETRANTSSESSSAANVDSGVDQLSDMSLKTKSELKEQMIFTEIFNSVLSKSERVQETEAQPRGKHSKSLSETLHVLFESAKSADLPGNPATQLPAKSPGLSSNSSSSHTAMLGARARMFEPSDAEKTRKAFVMKFVAPITEHIDAMDTNIDVIKYYTETVLPSINLDQPLTDGLLPRITPQTPIVNGDTAPYLLTKCMDVLIDSFRDPEGCLQLFEHVRRFRPSIYTSMCDSTVYNRIISIRWDFYNDLTAVADATSDMFINAIGGDFDTAELLGTIAVQADAARRGSMSSPHLPIRTKQDEQSIEILRKFRSRILESVAAKVGTSGPRIYS